MNTKAQVNRRTGIRRPSPELTGYWIRIAGLTVLVAAIVGSSTVISADSNAAAIDKTRATLEQWVQTQRVISQERKDWALAREILGQKIDLVQREIESLQGKIKDANTSIADADTKRAELIKDNDKLKDASSALSKTLVTLEDRIKRLTRRLPDPIRERIKPLSQRIPDKPDQTNLSISERFQNIVGILNEVDKFNRDITVTSEVRNLPDGSSVEVATLYIGIGQAYYVGAKGTVAGSGIPTDQGWAWKPNNQFAPQISELIAIFKNEKAASFVRVPVEIR